jgi:hypothetical protein
MEGLRFTGDANEFAAGASRGGNDGRMEMWKSPKAAISHIPTARLLRVYTDISIERNTLTFQLGANMSRSARKSHLPAQKKCLSNPQGAWSPSRTTDSARVRA